MYKRLLYKTLRTLQVNFPWLQDTKFKFIRIIRQMLTKPAEKDFEGMRLIHGIEQMNFVDIGANRGDTILSIRMFAKNAPITAFEPNPLVFEKLTHLLRNDPQIQVINSGLGNQPGEFYLYVPFYKNFMFDGLASFVESEARCWLKDRIFFFDEKHLHIKKVKCPIGLLDDYTLNPGFVKIDVQGFEYNVLVGAKQTFERNKPVLLIETPNTEVDNYLKTIGYLPYKYSSVNGFEEGFGTLNTYYFHQTKIQLMKKVGD
jgi:FkbM family methyltransferase